jgi:hypothetical protein
VFYEELYSEKQRLLFAVHAKSWPKEAKTLVKNMVLPAE